MAELHGLDGVTFIATKALRADAADAWSAWLHEHAAENGGGLWRLLDPGPHGRPGAGHSHVLHIPTARLGAFDAATATARADGIGAAHVETRRDDWTPVGSALVAGEGAITGLIVAEVLCADPERDDEWDRWYDEVHLPDMMASDAFVAGSRWRRPRPRQGSANHLTVYEVSGVTVDAAIERSAAVMPDLVAAGRKHECHAGGLTWALERVG